MSPKQYDNTNTFTLFVNDRKTQETHPDRTGTLNVDGVEYFIDGWLKKTKDGKPFLSGRIKRKEPKSADPPPQTYQQQQTPAEDDVPF